MRTDVAMRVHYRTLMKVKLFRNCDPGLVKDLVVLLRPIIYLPGDYVCQKGDSGKEVRLAHFTKFKLDCYVYHEFRFLNFACIYRLRAAGSWQAKAVIKRINANREGRGYSDL